MATQTTINGGKPDQNDVYMIYSNRSLQWIEDLLADAKAEVELLNVVYDRDGNETNRTLAVMAPSAYQKLCDKGYGASQRSFDFRILPFELRDNNFPGVGREPSLFIPVPNELRGKEKIVVEAITDKLAYLVEIGILPSDSHRARVLMDSREKGKVGGGCIVTFKDEVAQAARAKARLLMNDTYWPAIGDEDRLVFRCFWTRQRQEPPKKEEEEEGSKKRRK